MLIVPKDAFEAEEGGLWIQDSNVYDLKPFFKTQHLQVSTGLCHFSLDVFLENSKPFLIHQKTGIPLDFNTQTHTHTHTYIAYNDPPRCLTRHPTGLVDNQPTNRPTDRPTDRPTNRPTDESQGWNWASVVSRWSELGTWKISQPEGHRWLVMVVVVTRWKECLGGRYESCGWPSWVCDIYSGWWQLKCFLIFTPILGENIQFGEHIFQMGWFNHHPVISGWWKKTIGISFSTKQWDLYMCLNNISDDMNECEMRIAVYSRNGWCWFVSPTCGREGNSRIFLQMYYIYVQLGS